MNTFNCKGREGRATFTKTNSPNSHYFIGGAKACRFLASIVIASVVSGDAKPAMCQSEHVTVRHHRIKEEDPATAKISEAETDIANKDYAKAEPLLKDVLAQHPDNYTAWYDLGFLYHALGQRDDSIAAYRKSVAAKPDLFESNLNLGLELAEAHQPEAETYLRAATRLKPTADPTEGRKRAWMALGRFLEASKPDDAVGAFQQAALVAPSDVEPRLMAGALFEKLQRPADAEKEYQQALAIAPQSADAIATLTNFYMRQHDFAKAQSLLQKFVQLHPNDASAHLQLGRMLAIAGKNDEAMAEMEAGLKLDPSDNNAQRDLADLYADSGKYAKAEALYATLLASYPNDADLHHGLGHVLLREKKYAESEQELLKAVQLKPEGTTFGDLAVAANENQDYALAIKATDMRAKYLPEIPITYFLRATAYDHLHDAKQAAAYYHQFLQVAGGKYPDQEWQARHRLIAIEPKQK